MRSLVLSGIRGRNREASFEFSVVNRVERLIVETGQRTQGFAHVVGVGYEQAGYSFGVELVEYWLFTTDVDQLIDAMSRAWLFQN
ncbi:MAG: hypothetical protein ACI9UK_002383 [Candidatus Krumholzibacteriia bacterium]